MIKAVSKKELLFSVTKKDLKIDFFSGKGAGGQHRNKHQNCVRMSHPDSGAMATGQKHRERQSNVRDAFLAINKHPKFKLWMTRRVAEIRDEKTLDEKVDELMVPENIKAESKKDGKWQADNLPVTNM